MLSLEMILAVYLTHGLIRVRCCVVQDNLGNFRGFALESER